MRRARSRNTTKKFVYGLLAVLMLGAILVLGTGTGGSTGGLGTPTNTNGLLPVGLLALSRLRLRPAARS